MYVCMYKKNFYNKKKILIIVIVDSLMALTVCYKTDIMGHYDVFLSSILLWFLSNSIVSVKNVEITILNSQEECRRKNLVTHFTQKINK